ncbi:hypothetical protein H0B56_20730 [Haloechinothrix sp. YIM 98757]|uniref:PQQ-like domain-containing protein n=1 Tax=Haloechinothrix aidingensis TaxID=2752311 RepID=A0A838AFR1_9PSEU|nr:hypothetical protein [Haloechinothrix aidingensis]MBA0127977.1 hypothetical protein [Haloechinothrix aidingensis]
MVRARSRRSPWTRRRDRVAAVSLAVGVALAGVLAWRTGDSVATEQVTTGEPAPELQPPTRAPESFAQLWSAPSSVTTVPVTVGGTVVTAEDGAVTGRHARTGEPRWSYTRDLDLCALSDHWDKVTAAYRKEDGCSEVTQLSPESGHRTAQRNGDAQADALLIGDGSHLVTTGETLLNAWSEDLVRTMEYGDVPAKVHPGKQPRQGCAYGSVTVAAGQVGLVERCPDDDTDRLTVIGTTHQADDEMRSDEPDERYSTTLDGTSARVIAMSGEEPGLAAVATGEDQQLVVYGPDGERLAGYQLQLPADDLAGDPDGRVVATSRTGDTVYWYTGSGTIALAGADLEPQWSLPDTLGPPVAYGDELLMPIDGGLAVVEADTGKAERTISVDRGAYSGPVRLATSGPVLLEQRAGKLVALAG